MSKHNLVSNAVRLALVCGVATGLAAKSAFAADTDQAAADQSTAQLGKIEVTGSRIKRTEVEQAQPVTVVTSQMIKQSGLATVGQIIQKLTSTGAALNTLDNFGGNFTFTGGGQSGVDLRNLGSQRVLVLVNGKRWVTGLDGSVDLNTIPTSVIDHIEVLQDGASAIYGSDAISGVVNIITLKDYNGRGASAYQGMYNGDGHWDGRTNAYDFTMGSSNDHSGLLFNAAYTNQDGILSKNRNISKEPIIGEGNASGSSAIPNGRFFVLPPASSPWFAYCGPSCDLTIVDNPTPLPNGKLPMTDFRPFVSGGPNSDRFNYAPFNYVLTPEERYSTYVQGYTDLADNITFKADMMYSHRDSRQQAAPEPLFFASSSINIDIPANQRYNPFGFDLNTDTNLGLLGRRMVENGIRTYHEKEDTYRISGGLDGFFNMLGGEWDWDASYAFSKDSEIDVNGGHFDVSHLRLALGDPAICAAVSGCVPLNLFGGQGAITKRMLDYIAYTAQNQFENNQRVYNADITNNSLMQLPGGSLGLALGVQDLEHDGFFLPDSVAQNGYDSFNPGRPVAPTSGRTDEKSLYAEVDIPFLGNLPAVKLMDLDIAGRHTKYNTYGTNNTYRWGYKWEVDNNLLIRATWSQGFRAPSIQDLYSGNTNLSAQIQDPCSGPVAGRPKTCTGVPASYVQPNAQINTLEGGNPNLKPETSISRTVGFVWSPDLLPGFNLNADYYNIQVNNTIQPISGQAILDGCYFGGNAEYCSHIVRSPTFGTITTLNDQITNVGNTITSGIDIGVTYAFPSTSSGDYKLSFDDSHIRSYRLVTPNPTGAPTTEELAGTQRGGTVFPFGVPHDKARLSLDWSSGNWTAQYGLRYISALWEPCIDATKPAPIGDGSCSTPGPINPAGTDYKYAMNHEGATTYHDVQVGYNMDSWQTTFTFGIRNIWAKQPPISAVQQLNSFDPTLYDVPGRFVYLRAAVKF